MNNLAYMILIGVLLLVAALMLYARFVARSREKSLHHGLGEYSQRSDESESSSLRESADEHDFDAGDSDFEVKAEPVGEEIDGSKDDEYLDELQEAAAGLAVLMRSSPVSNRSTPVVFAPGESDAKVEPDAENGSERIEANMVSEPLEPKVVEESPENNEEEASKCEEPNPEQALEESFSVHEILGEEVGAQFDRIDSGLDALEELVVSIESGISELTREGSEEAAAESIPESEGVVEAA